MITKIADWLLSIVGDLMKLHLTRPYARGLLYHVLSAWSLFPFPPCCDHLDKGGGFCTCEAVDSGLKNNLMACSHRRI